MTWFAGPPDGTQLLVHYTPVCNELTLNGIAKAIDGAKGLRARGFRRVACYPDSLYWFDIPPIGDPVEIVQPGGGDGWYCVIIGRELDAGICIRDPGRCRYLAQTTQGAEPTCEVRRKAYCSSNAGTETCYTTAEACVHLSAGGSTPCDLQR